MGGTHRVWNRVESVRTVVAKLQEQHPDWVVVLGSALGDPAMQRALADHNIAPDPRIFEHLTHLLFVADAEGEHSFVVFQSEENTARKYGQPFDFPVPVSTQPVFMCFTVTSSKALWKRVRKLLDLQ